MIIVWCILIWYSLAIISHIVFYIYNDVINPITSLIEVYRGSPILSSILITLIFLGLLSLGPFLSIIHIIATKNNRRADILEKMEKDKIFARKYKIKQLL